MQSPPIRAFIALQPPEAWTAELRTLQVRLKHALESHAFKWVEPENIHITLRFLGSISTEDAELAGRVMAEAALNCPAFTVQTSTLGCFPSARRARVLWLGVTGEIEALSGFNAEIQRRTARIGQLPDDRPFTAHLTLARIKDLDRASSLRLESAVEKISAPQLTWEVNQVLLMRSHLSPRGAQYEKLISAPLGKSIQ